MTGETYRIDEETIKGLEEALQCALDTSVREKYGERPDERILARIQEEWNAMLCSESVADIASVHEITMCLREGGYQYCVANDAGASFLCYLLDISSVNPLPLHIFCPICKKVTFCKSQEDSTDAPGTMICEHNKTDWVTDGCDIPWQPIWGDGSHKPVFNIVAPPNAYQQFLKYVDRSWLLKEVQPIPVFRLNHLKEQCVEFPRITICFSKEPGIKTSSAQ